MRARLHPPARAQFEIPYAPLLPSFTASTPAQTAQARRNTLSLARDLVRITKGRGIVLSSGGPAGGGEWGAVRAPGDVVNLGTLMGLSPEKAHDAVVRSPKSVVLRARESHLPALTLARRAQRSLADPLSPIDPPPFTHARDAKDVQGPPLGPSGRRRRRCAGRGGRSRRRAGGHGRRLTALLHAVERTRPRSACPPLPSACRASHADLQRRKGPSIAILVQIGAPSLPPVRGPAVYGLAARARAASSSSASSKQRAARRTSSNVL